MNKTHPESSSVLGARHEAASDAFFQEAVSFAARAHRNQLRKDGRTPYVAHVIRVALTVRVVFGCEDAVALQAAILHDAIEDTTTDYDDITERFGEDVAACVSALTKNMALPEYEREREYDARLAKATWQARLVKLADAYDNLCDVADFSEKDKAKKTASAVERARRALALSVGDVSQASVARARESLTRLVNAIVAWGVDRCTGRAGRWLRRNSEKSRSPRRCRMRIPVPLCLPPLASPFWSAFKGLGSD